MESVFRETVAWLHGAAEACCQQLFNYSRRNSLWFSTEKCLEFFRAFNSLMPNVLGEGLSEEDLVGWC